MSACWLTVATCHAAQSSLQRVLDCAKAILQNNVACFKPDQGYLLVRGVATHRLENIGVTSTSLVKDIVRGEVKELTFTNY